MPTWVHFLANEFRAWPGSLKLALAMLVPVVIVGVLDWHLRRLSSRS